MVQDFSKLTTGYLSLAPTSVAPQFAGRREIQRARQTLLTAVTPARSPGSK